ICLGMQIAVIEFSRNLCNLPNAISVDFDERPLDPVVVYMPELDRKNMAGDMRLGGRTTHFQNGSDWSKAYAL
ncbi:uncharacterized protein BCR38DRAFT_327263, partial [Pseudomassariella vexata]